MLTVRRKPQKYLVGHDETLSAKASSVAESSRPRRQYKEAEKVKNKPQGRKRKHAKITAARVNWKSPFLWSHIELAAVQAGKPWKPHDIALQAKLIDPVAFMRLTEQVVGRWIDRAAQEEGISKWKDSVLAEVEKGNAPGGQSTRTGILVSLSI